MSRILGALLLSISLTGCFGVVEDDPVQQDSELGLPFGPLRAMTRNMSIGGDTAAVVGAPAQQVPLIVAQVWAQIEASLPADRIEAMADEIATNRPHVVGLQEVALIRTQFPGDLVRGGTTPATDVAYDFLQMLVDALEARGHHYEVVTKVANTDVELPRLNAADFTFTDVRLTEYAAILARSDVDTANAASANYALALPAGGITIKRGWNATDAEVGGTTYRFVNTHLEAWHPGIRGGQAQELAAILAGETKPTVVVGDMNDETFTDAYAVFAGAGFGDAWTKRLVPKGGTGYTCCHEDPTDPASTLEKRIDLVLTKNFSRLFVPLSYVIGDEERDMTDSGVWPSDHAGVMAWVQNLRR